MTTQVSSNAAMNGHGPVRPSAPIGAATCRDIHITEQGQHSHPQGPTRIATWRPIKSESIPKVKPNHTPEEEAKIAELRKYTEENLLLSSDDEYYPWEKKFLDTRNTYSRYMRAADWNLDNAKKRIKGTLEWRRSYKPDLIKPEEIRVETEGGKIIINGFDREGRPIIWLRPSRENTKPSPRQIRHLIFQLERAIDLMPEGVEKMALVVDYKGATSSNNPSLKTVKEVIHILQNHYVERLGKGIVVNVPFYLQAFFELVKKLLDPKPKAKVEFNPKLEKLVPIEQLDSEFGGNFNYIYDHNVYFTALCHFCGIKEDGTREDIIPKDIPASKPEEMQRTLTQQTGDTMDEAAEYARKESEAQARQDEEARLYAERGGQMQFDDDDSVTYDTAQDASVDKTRSGWENPAVGGSVVAAAAAASIAAARKSGQNATATQPVATNTRDTLPDSTATHSDTRKVETNSDSVQPTNNVEKVSREYSTKTTDNATHSAVPSQSAPPAGSTTVDHTKESDTAKPTIQTDTTKSPVQLDTAKLSVQPDTANSTVQSNTANHTAQPFATNHATKPDTVDRCVAPQTAAADHTPTKVAPPASNAQQPARKKGGWKLFSSKRGLDKEGNPTAHKHKHISKAFCMHKGAVDPSKISSIQGTSAGKSSIDTSAAANGTADTPGNGRIKIAPEAIDGREERTYNNAPLATNATFGPDAYHTAMEAYPTSGEGDNEGGDYFTDMRKIPPIKPTDVEHEEKDKAKLLQRPTEIMNRLHEGGTGDLVLAFEVKQPPIEPESAVEDDGENATAEAANKAEEKVKTNDKTKA